MNQRQELLPTRTLLILLMVLASVYLAGFLWQLLVSLGDILLLFFLAWLVAVLMAPAVNWLERWRLPSGVAIALVYLGLTLLLVLLGLLLLPSVVAQLGELGRNLPGYVQELPTAVERFQGWLAQQGVKLELLPAFPAEALAQRAEALGTATAQLTLTFLQSIMSVLLGTILVVILSVYITADRHRLARGLLGLLPAQYRDEGRFFLANVDRTFGGYLRGMVIMALIYGVGNAGVMLLFGLDYVAPASVFAGLMMFIPFLGTFLAIIPPVLIAFFTASAAQAGVVLVVLFVLQQVILNGVAPRVLSHSVGMPPLLIFVALLLGIKLAGFWGALFGVPVVAVIYSMVAFFMERGQVGPTQASVGLGEEKPIGSSPLKAEEEM